MVHISLEGPNFVLVARELLLDGNPSKAWRLLAEGLIGEGSDTAARQILMGTHTLSGNNRDGLELEEDPNSAEYVQKMTSLYAGRVQIRDVWYRPHAIVAGYHIPDGGFEKFDQERSSKRVPVSDHNALRTAYYARDGEIVISVEHSEGQWPVKVKVSFGETTSIKRVSNILFAPCGEPPHWWRAPRTVDDAFDAFVAAGGILEERGSGMYSMDDRFKPAVDPLPPVESEPDVNDELDEVDHPEDIALRAQCAEWQAQIMAQNGPDMIDLMDEAGKLVASVPRKPFMAYALERTEYADQAPWTPVCPSGLKLQGDSRAHTDWYVGYGGSLVNGYPYRSELDLAAGRMMFSLQRAFTGSDCAILVDGPPVTGVVGQDVIVLPNLDPKYLPQVLGARAIITEQGGALAHLAQVALERCIPVVLHPEARSVFAKGMRVTVNAVNGTVRVL